MDFSHYSFLDSAIQPESLLLEIVRHYHELMIKIVTLSLKRKAILWTEEF